MTRYLLIIGWCLALGAWGCASEVGSEDPAGESGGSGGVATGGASSGGTITGGTTTGGVETGGTTTGGVGTGGSSNVCATAAEEASLSLTCPMGQVIAQIIFASYGTPSGDCGSFAVGTCDAAASVDVVEALCLGRDACTLTAQNATFGDPCNSTTKSLAVEVSCGTDAPVGTVPYKGVANSSCEDRTALSVSWYYNWMQYESEPCSGDGGGEFVPMIWGHPGDEQDPTAIASSVTSFVSQGYGHVLGFNEPDNPSQSNIPVGTAISLLPSFDDSGILVGSPATAANANPGQAWFTDFMTQLNANSDLRVDFLAVHWYGWNAGSCDADAAQLENYLRWVEGFAGNRPIWITEFGCLNQSAPDEATVVAFYRGVLAMLARHPRVERYAWYPWADFCHLTEDGVLTALGAEYAAAPAFR